MIPPAKSWFNLLKQHADIYIETQPRPISGHSAPASPAAPLAAALWDTPAHLYAFCSVCVWLDLARRCSSCHRCLHKMWRPVPGRDENALYLSVPADGAAVKCSSCTFTRVYRRWRSTGGWDCLPPCAEYVCIPVEIANVRFSTCFCPPWSWFLCKLLYYLLLPGLQKVAICRWQTFCTAASCIILWSCRGQRGGKNRKHTAINGVSGVAAGNCCQQSTNHLCWKGAILMNLLSFSPAEFSTSPLMLTKIPLFNISPRCLHGAENTTLKGQDRSKIATLKSKVQVSSC